MVFCTFRLQIAYRRTCARTYGQCSAAQTGEFVNKSNSSVYPGN